MESPGIAESTASLVLAEFDLLHAASGERIAFSHYRVIKEDKLGLDMVYIQAKRWDNAPVGSKEIQAFVGALHGKKARKGVFITTSDFSKAAHEYVREIQDKVILINGEELADLLIEHGVGVSTVATYDIKKVDLDFFSEE